MLKRLSISNYALIKRAEVDFHSGFTVVTGESGAGKSIMLEAVGLLLGARANFSTVRKGEAKCFVEATFSMDNKAVHALLGEHHLDQLKDLIVRRELTAEGRSRAFVNDTPVNVAVLKELGRLLIDLHGQQENLALQTAHYQCQQLDQYSESRTLHSTYSTAYQSWKQAQRQLDDLRDAAAQVRKDQDYFQFQHEELSALSFDAEAHATLEGELNELEHAGEILSTLGKISQILTEEQYGALESLRSASSESDALSQHSHSLKDIHERLKSAHIELSDLNNEVERVMDNIEVNPNRLEEVREKLDDYNRLMHKHGVSTLEDLKAVFDEYALKLEGIESFDSEIDRLERKVAQARAEALKLAQDLSSQRRKAKPGFEKALLEQVHQLGMPKAHFELAIETRDELGVLGLDRIEMRFNANGKDHLSPLQEVASGGEVARLMLALKSIVSRSSESMTMIFDEIDTGVSGEVAKRIGQLMKALGTKAQIISVTHLPGVAAKGDQHLKIYKEEQEGSVVSNLLHLQPGQRVEELAAMFSGDQLTEASLESARNLLANDN